MFKQVASTLYRLSLVLTKLGAFDISLSHLEEAISILYPKRHTENNLDLASVFCLIGIIHVEKGEVDNAIYYIDLAQQVEIHILGEVTEMTRSKFMSLQFNELPEEYDMPW